MTDVNLATGDAKTDAKIQSATTKLASGQPLTSDETLAIGAGAVGALGAAASVPGMGPVFAAMVAGELAFAAGLDWFFTKLGLHAGAGAGACADLGPPSGPSDPRYRHANISDPGWGPASTPFERFAIPIMQRAWEIANNCGPTWPFTWTQLLQKLAAIWNETHDGPVYVYPEGSGWGGQPPFSSEVPSGGLAVNTGPPNGRGQLVSRFPLSIHLSSTGHSSPADLLVGAGIGTTSTSMTTGEKVAIGVVATGAAVGAGYALWRTFPVWRRLFR